MQEDHQLLLRQFSELQQALSELATIYNDVPVGLAVIGADYRFQRINARLAEMNGVPAADHIGRTVRDVVPKLADIAERLIRQAVETGEPILNLEIEGETAAQPGVLRSFIEHWTPLKDQDGRVTAVIIVAEEVTAQKRAEAALRASEARLREVLDTLQDGFILMDPEFRILQMNAETLRRAGRPLAELVGRTHWEIWPSSAGGELEMNFRKAAAERVPVRFEHHHVDSERDLWVDISAYPTAEGIAAFYRDITARKRAEIERFENERRLDTALRAGNLGVFEYVFGPPHRYYWDRTIRQIWGVSETEEITDRHYWDSLHAEDAPKVMAIFERISRREVSRVDTEYRIRRFSDEALRWVSVALDIVQDERGPSKMIGTIQDITERKRAEEHAHLLMREVNHRSKNLLAVVQSIAHQTARTSDPELFAVRFSERLAALAASQDLLVHSQWKGVDFRALVTSQLAHFKHLVGQRIHLEGPPLKVSANAAQSLGMALHELATNAAKYGALSTAEGEVTIAWSLSGSEAGETFHLAWTEAGGPPVAAPTQQGLGTHIITRLLRHSLGAEVTLDFPPAGLAWALSAPASVLLEDATAS